MKHVAFEPGGSERPMFPQFAAAPVPMAYWTPRFRAFKRLVDLVFCLVVAPVVLAGAVVLLAVNPFLNPGPLFFRQERMGMGGVRFQMWKFRTMLSCSGPKREHDAPLETHRITPLGRFLRRTRFDELPNFFNILRGEMTLVGPRPDAWDHAMKYIDVIPYYADRFRVRPGITGLAQVRGGYADNIRAVRRKARLDRFYVRKSRLLFDLRIIARTVLVVFSGFGAR